jgi:hypothetical protein
MTGEWLSPLLSFAGAALGAGLSYFGIRTGTRQQETQGRREEWGRRFTAALDAAGDTSAPRRRLGLLLLGKLARSSLASDEERQLADDLLDAAARYDPRGADLRLIRRGQGVDDLRIVQEDGASEPDQGGEERPS